MYRRVCFYLVVPPMLQGTWRGKMVAVKVVHYTSASLMEVNLPERGTSLAQPLDRRPARQHSSHMALMEAVIGAHISHPNIVQVRGPVYHSSRGTQSATMCQDLHAVCS
jgi:hypothetical protein